MDYKLRLKNYIQGTKYKQVRNNQFEKYMCLPKNYVQPFSLVNNIFYLLVNFIRVPRAKGLKAKG
jgi:hypothetical protein